MKKPTPELATKKLVFSGNVVFEQFSTGAAFPRRVRVENDRDRVGFFACLSGRSRISMDGGGSVCLGRGICGTYREAKGTVSVAEYDDREPYSMVSITMPPGAAGTVFGVDLGEAPYLPDDEHRIGRNCGMRTLPLRSHISRALQDILDPPVREPLCRAYLECKVLEVLAYALNDTCFGADAASVSLTSGEIDRIHAIRDAIDGNLSHSPSLVDLACSFGFTHNKLNRGFKALFGATVYEYLREQRLDRAHELLLSGDCNVTEACLQVGYSNLSHFAKMYRKKFGQNPGGMKRRTDIRA